MTSVDTSGSPRALESDARRGSGPLRVVIVEDSKVIRERLGETLRQIPNLATIAFAETQEEALVVLRDHEWDVLLLDLQLKRGTGIGVLEGLAETARRPMTTVIVFTNYDFAQYRKKAASLGADYYFDKSLEFHRVPELLAELARRAT
jgi:DNA-binding NarL/FixJ family response regulator